MAPCRAPRGYPKKSKEKQAAHKSAQGFQRFRLPSHRRSAPQMEYFGSRAGGRGPGRRGKAVCVCAIELRSASTVSESVIAPVPRQTVHRVLTPGAVCCARKSKVWLHTVLLPPCGSRVMSGGAPTTQRAAGDWRACPPPFVGDPAVWLPAWPGGKEVGLVGG